MNGVRKPSKLELGLITMRQSDHMAILRWTETSLDDLVADDFSKMELKIMSNLKFLFHRMGGQVDWLLKERYLQNWRSSSELLMPLGEFYSIDLIWTTSLLGSLV